MSIRPSPVVALNRAVAVAMAGSPDDGLALLDDPALAEDLSDYHLYHAARADLLRRTRRNVKAAEAYERAITLASNPAEEQYLRKRLREVTRGSPLSS